MLMMARMMKSMMMRFRMMMVSRNNAKSIENENRIEIVVIISGKSTKVRIEV